MSRPQTRMTSALALFAIMISSVAVGQTVSQPSFSPTPDSPAARMRPIGSASAVDQYRQRPATTSRAVLRETGYRNSFSSPSSSSQQRNVGAGSVRQTAMQFGLPDGGSNAVGPPITSPTPNFATPGSGSAAPSPPAQLPPQEFAQQLPGQQPPIQQFQGQQFQAQQLPTQQLPTQQLPGQSNLPFPAPNTAVPLPPRTDYAPMAAPSLGGSISNINNCANVTGPSGYSAAFSSACGGCAPVTYQAPLPQAFQAPPAQIAAPAIVPGPQFNAPLVAPTVAATSSAPVGSLLSFGQERFPVQVGQGILGQPKAYVPGQRVRNWLRYFTP